MLRDGRTSLGSWLRRGAIAVVGLVIAWAFVHVAVREWNRSSGTDERTELVVMHWSGDGGQEEDQIVDASLRAFEAANPGIRVRRVNPGDAGSFYTKLMTMLAAGEPPDVFYVGNERVPSFADIGLIRPLEPFLDADRAANDPTAIDLADFYPATVDAFRFDGTASGRGALYGIPKDFTTVGFYLNLDLFERAGVPVPGNDWTWDEFLAAARAIGQLPDATGSEFVTWAAMLRAYLMTEGVDVKGADFDELTIEDPRAVRALERLRAWRHDEDNTLTSGKSKIATGSSVFLSGKVGMAGPFGRWVVPSYRKIPPAGEPGGFRWDFRPLPRGAVASNIVLTVSWSIASRSKHPDQAWRLVKWMTDDRSQRDLAKLGLAIPTRKAAAMGPEFSDPTQEPANDAGYLLAAERAQVVEWPVNPQFESLFASTMDAALKTGTISVREAIDTFLRDWTSESQSPLAKADLAPMPWRGLTMAGLAALAAATAWFIWWMRSSKGSSAHRAEERAGWLLASPWVIGFLAFMAFPVVMSLVLSLARWKGVSTLEEAEFAGFANYERLLTDDARLRTSLRVTLYYALIAVPLGQAIALAAAMLMNLKVRGIALWRAAWYLPSVLAGVGVSVLWRWVFDADGGLMNRMLGGIIGGMDAALSWFGAGPTGLVPPEWFEADAAVWGAPAFAIMSFWFMGGTMMVYLAGLQQVPIDLHEAASIDGAGRLRRFVSVTLPMLSPVILFNVIMAVIGSFQVFTQAFVMTGGDPNNLTRFYVLYLYNQAFEFYEMGYASAMAWLLLAMVLVLTVVLMRTSSRFVHHEGAPR